MWSKWALGALLCFSFEYMPEPDFQCCAQYARPVYVGPIAVRELARWAYNNTNKITIRPTNNNHRRNKCLKYNEKSPQTLFYENNDKKLVSVDIMDRLRT